MTVQLGNDARDQYSHFLVEWFFPLGKNSETKS